MGCYDADELAGRDHLGLLPELRKMPLVASHQVVGTGSIRALQKLVVAGVLRDLERTRWADELRTALYELEELLPGSPADFKFGHESTSRYSARTASGKYSLAGFVIVSTRTVRWSPSGFRAAETSILVSITSLSGIIRA